MYEQFFGFKEKPFSLTPDTDFFYRHGGHQEAINVLLVALRNGEGFVRVTGEVGTGKTLLCRQLLKVLSKDCATVYLPNPLFSPLELYQAIASELELSATEQASVQQLYQRILQELIRLRDENRPLVVMIDEAQAMPHETLEALRLLSNLETAKEKLLHVFFFAQPEFDQRLAQPDLRQLLQRISFSYQLSTLSQDELAAYLEHRLKVAGYQGGALFDAAAVKLLYKASSGVPRLINLLAHKALLAAYGKGLSRVDQRVMQAAITDTKVTESLAWTGSADFVFEIGAVVLLAAMTLLLLRFLS
ncbi:MAG TPA: AAA family ATPase [Malonomonas sp.]